MATAGTRRKAAPVEEPEEDEFEEMEEGEDEDDLEELEEEPEEKPKPKGKKAAAGTKRTPPKQPVIEFGSPWLAAYITEQTGETYDARGIRMLLRKLAKDGAGVTRDVGVDKGRYQFTGPGDEQVQAVLAMVQSGAAKELKQAGLAAVKEKAAEKKKLAAAAKAKAAEEAADEDDDMEEVEEEAPKPRRTRAAAAKPAAPAKATPARRRAATAK